MKAMPAPGRFVDVENLVKRYPQRGGFLGRRREFTAVHGVSFHIREGETLGLVGESGSGKSTIGRAILMLDPPTAGTVTIDGCNLTRSSHAELKALRRIIQPVFQDPYASLNPRMRIGDAIAEPLEIHGVGADRAERLERVAELLRRVGLPDEFARRFPHEMSGGQRQRVSIARAIALSPRFIVADEPISALDVSIQAQIINLFMDLQDELGLTYLMISHDLSMVRHVCHRVAVLNAGRIVEMGPIRAVYENAQHAYTKLLLSAIPRPDPRYPVHFDLAAIDRSRALPAGKTVLTEVDPGHLVAVPA